MGRQFDSPEARVLLLAIAGQESNFEYRRQHNGGPARGLWQFEGGSGSALAGLLEWPSGPIADARDRALGDRKLLGASITVVYERLATDDHLACALARLLLWTHPRVLPSLGDQDAAWIYYINLWRPGRPHPERWGANYSTAINAFAPSSDYTRKEDRATIEQPTVERVDMPVPFGDDARNAARAVWARIGKETTEYRISIVTLALLVFCWIGPALAEGVLAAWFPGVKIPPAPPILYLCMTAIAGLYVLSRWSVKAKAAENDV